MGTRNLICVVKDDKYRVAQYGQWDGYPEGQGITALNLLHSMDLEKFKDQVSKTEFISKKEIDKIIQQAEGNWSKAYPQFSRDTGTEILSIVYNAEKPIQLYNSIDFAADSLFCEWAYVIDLDKNTFEVYEGFNQFPLSEEDRFYQFNDNQTN